MKRRETERLHEPASRTNASTDSAGLVQFKQGLTGMPYDEQVQALRPPMPIQYSTASPVQMAARGNQADTGIVNEANQMISKGEATDMKSALAKMMSAAKAARDKAKVQKIKKTQKATGSRHSRQSR